MVVGLGADRDDRVVAKAVDARGEQDAPDRIAMAVNELLGRQVVPERQGLEQHGVVAVRLRRRLSRRTAVPETS